MGVEEERSPKLHGKGPNLPVGAGGYPFFEIPGLGTSVISIFFNAAEDECNLLGIHKAKILLVDGAVRKVDQENIASNAGGNGSQAENKKDPTPAF